MNPPQKQTEDPRPFCKECLRPVDPKTAAVILPEALRDRDHAETVVGIYCCDDHAIDAWLRGFPMQDTIIW